MKIQKVLKILCVVTLIIIVSQPAFANKKNIALLDHIDTNTLMIPIELYDGDKNWGEYWDNQSDAAKAIGIVEAIKEISKSVVTQKKYENTRTHYLNMIGYTTGDVIELENFAKSGIFVKNVCFRMDMMLDTYENECDIVKTTILCRSGNKPCIKHALGNSGHDCEVIPFPSYDEALAYQILIELRCQQYSNISL